MSSPLELLARLGLARVEGALIAIELIPMRGCFREFAGLAREHGKLDYARQRLLEDPLNVTSNIAVYCLLRRLRDAKIELEEAELAKLTAAYLTLLYETEALIYLSELLGEILGGTSPKTPALN